MRGVDMQGGSLRTLDFLPIAWACVLQNPLCSPSMPTARYRHQGFADLPSRWFWPVFRSTQPPLAAARKLFKLRFLGWDYGSGRKPKPDDLAQQVGKSQERQQQHPQHNGAPYQANDQGEVGEFGCFQRIMGL